MTIVSANSPRILIVDDHGDVTHLLARFLRRSGYDAAEAADDATALRLAADAAIAGTGSSFS